MGTDTTRDWATARVTIHDSPFPRISSACITIPVALLHESDSMLPAYLKGTTFI